MTDRNRLRHEIRRRRAALTPGQRERAARHVAARLAATAWFRRARHVAGYLAIGGELDALPALTAARIARKHLYLPALAAHGGLWFHPWHPGMPMRSNRFGIDEPLATPRRRKDPRALDIVLTPLVAFDRHGHRLGMGGGFYDRTFAYQLGIPVRRPVLIGLAYDFQEVENLATETWDVPLAAVVTPRGVHRFT